jgi:hypothetical protein
MRRSKTISLEEAVNDYIKEMILYVHLNSSVVRNELLMLRETLREKLNQKAGSEVIKDIVLR